LRAEWLDLVRFETDRKKLRSFRSWRRTPEDGVRRPESQRRRRFR